MEAFTARAAVKYVAKAAIHLKTSQLTKNAISDHTQFENDDIVVELTGGVVGWYVSDKLKPYSDKMVDKAADKIVELRAARAAKKTPTE